MWNKWCFCAPWVPRNIMDTDFSRAWWPGNQSSSVLVLPANKPRLNIHTETETNKRILDKDRNLENKAAGCLFVFLYKSTIVQYNGQRARALFTLGDAPRLLWVVPFCWYIRNKLTQNDACLYFSYTCQHVEAKFKVWTIWSRQNSFWTLRIKTIQDESAFLDECTGHALALSCQKLTFLTKVWRIVGISSLHPKDKSVTRVKKTEPILGGMSPSFVHSLIKKNPFWLHDKW